MLTIAQIAAVVAAGLVGQMSDRSLNDASYSVLFAIDPKHMGDEPHLVVNVDPCGLGDEALHDLDQALWAELARREDARHAALAAALPLAA